MDLNIDMIRRKTAYDLSVFLSHFFLKLIYAIWLNKKEVVFFCFVTYKEEEKTGIAK